MACLINLLNNGVNGVDGFDGVNGVFDNLPKKDVVKNPGNCKTLLLPNLTKPNLRSRVVDDRSIGLPMLRPMVGGYQTRH